MHDPAYQKRAEEFCAQAAPDPTLESMAVYAKAMVLGRGVFERARADNLTEEASRYESLRHFTRTIGTSGTFPF